MGKLDYIKQGKHLSPITLINFILGNVITLKRNSVGVLKPVHHYFTSIANKDPSSFITFRELILVHTSNKEELFYGYIAILWAIKNSSSYSSSAGMVKRSVNLFYPIEINLFTVFVHFCHDP